MATTNATDGTSLRYEDLGPNDGPQSAIVLVHGITESSEVWQPIADRLSTDHRVLTLDLRGHGRSAEADRYDLEAMAGDVAAVVRAAGADRPHLVGHSLGGAVVSAAGAVMSVSSIVNVDQSLQLGAFKEALAPLEAMLRDADTFGSMIDGLFAELAGSQLPAEEMTRIASLRKADQEVVLGVWELLFSTSSDEIDGFVDEALAGYRSNPTRYLSLFGIDPGSDYEHWLQSRISGAVVELWDGHGHYPHLVEPDRFVDRLQSFWS